MVSMAAMPATANVAREVDAGLYTSVHSPGVENGEFFLSQGRGDDCRRDETTHLGRRGLPGSLFTELGHAAYTHEEKIQ